MLAVCMLIEDLEGKILFTRRCKGLVYEYAWVLPGGHIDLNERLEHGVIREIREETGINIVEEEAKRFMFAGKEVSLEPYYAFESNMVWGGTSAKGP